jgi:hypothetical protein
MEGKKVHIDETTTAGCRTQREEGELHILFVMYSGQEAIS